MASSPMDASEIFLTAPTAPLSQLGYEHLINQLDRNWALIPANPAAGFWTNALPAPRANLGTISIFLYTDFTE